MPPRNRAVSRRPLEHFTEVSLGGLLGVASAGAAFGILLMLVRFHWEPLYRLDHGAAAWLNSVVSPHGPLVTVLQAVTDLGGRPIMMWLVSVAVIGLLIRRQARLAIYLLVTGAGALALDPALKILVGRLRPVVEVPVASAPGNSFPSGHALGSIVAYGALLLIFLPVLTRKGLRAPAVGVVAGLVLLIGLTRIALGVHFVSDVIAGWLLGLGWLGITAYAFRLWRRETGQRVPPITEGLEPEAAPEIAPAPREGSLLQHSWFGAAELITGWVLAFSVLFGFGMLLTRVSDGTFVDTLDTAVPRWLAEHRTPTLDQVSWVLSKLGDTHAILAVSLVFCPLALALWRQWRPVLFLALVLFGELGLFLATSAAVDRDRPAVPHLDGRLPTSSFPSGHIAATLCLYTAMAVLILPRTDRWWRWLFVAAAVVMPTAVAVSRMYRGMHHPSDVVGAMLLTALWVPAVWWVVRPDVSLDETEEPAATAEHDHGLVGTARLDPR